MELKWNTDEIFSQTHIPNSHYLYRGDGLFGIYVMNGGNDTMYYIHKDYLGSYDVISDEAGNVLERLNFDPWGRRRNANDWTYDNVPSPRYFDRGYTGHEHLDVFGLINMNGRVYDPWLGRFLSPDPFVQSPGSSQSYNRYSYCLNNPLKYIDPSGYKQKPFYPWEAQATYSSGSGFDGRIGPGSGNHWSDQYSGADMSSPGSYTYNWSDGKYYDRYGNRVSFGEVFANYVLPNRVDVPYSLFLPSSNQSQKGNNNHQQNVQPVITYDFIAAISHIILSNSSMMFGGTLDGFFQEIPQESVLNDWLTMSDADKISILINSIREAWEEGNETLDIRKIFINIPKIAGGIFYGEDLHGIIKYDGGQLELNLGVTINKNMIIFTIAQYHQLGPDRYGNYIDHFYFNKAGANQGILDFNTISTSISDDILWNLLNP